MIFGLSTPLAQLLQLLECLLQTLLALSGSTFLSRLARVLASRVSPSAASRRICSRAVLRQALSRALYDHFIKIGS
jgi:hypothetical protein